MGRRTQDPSQFSLGFGAAAEACPPAKATRTQSTAAQAEAGRTVRAIATPVRTPEPPSVASRARELPRRAESGRKDFLVGRLTRSTREVRILGGSPSPIRGPFALHALVRSSGPSLRLV